MARSDSSAPATEPGMLEAYRDRALSTPEPHDKPAPSMQGGYLYYEDTALIALADLDFVPYKVAVKLPEAAS